MNKLNLNKIVRILGTQYEIVEDKRICDLAEADGLCNYYNKKIYIRPMDDIFQNEVTADDECRENRYNEILRHEIIHAFFDEAGLDNYSKDEQLVTLLAMQFHKIQDAFEKLEI